MAISNRELVITIISDKFNVPRGEIKDSSHLFEDLGAESLGLIELIMLLEDQFAIKVRDENYHKLVTVGAIVDLVNE